MRLPFVPTRTSCISMANFHPAKVTYGLHQWLLWYDLWETCRVLERMRLSTIEIRILPKSTRTPASTLMQFSIFLEVYCSAHHLAASLDSMRTSTLCPGICVMYTKKYQDILFPHSENSLLSSSTSDFFAGCICCICLKPLRCWYAGFAIRRHRTQIIQAHQAGRYIYSHHQYWDWQEPCRGGKHMAGQIVSLTTLQATDLALTSLQMSVAVSMQQVGVMRLCSHAFVWAGITVNPDLA